MSHALISLISGFIFAIGLGLGGMTRPEKVIGFLDVAGAWDPSLTLVMGGAVFVYFFAFRAITRRRARPVLAARFAIPSRRELDAPLLLGAALFGVGWGLGGFCPGPALTSLVTADGGVLTFVAAMLAGMAAHTLYQRATTRT